MNKNMASRFLSTQLQLESVQPIMEHNHEPVAFDSNEMEVSFDGVSWETVPLTTKGGEWREDEVNLWGRNTPSGKTRIDDQFKTAFGPCLESGLSDRTRAIIDANLHNNPSPPLDGNTLHVAWGNNQGEPLVIDSLPRTTAPVDIDVACMYTNPIRPLGSVGRFLALNGGHTKNPRKAGAPKRRKKSKTFGKNK